MPNEPTTGTGPEKFFAWLRRNPVRRPRQGRLIGGVAAGVARQTEIDPMLVRIVFVLLAIFSGIGITAYLLAWFLVPDESDVTAAERAWSRDAGAILLGVVTVLSVLSRPRDNGWVPTLISLAVCGVLLYLLIRYLRGRGHLPTWGGSAGPNPGGAGASGSDWRPSAGATGPVAGDLDTGMNRPQGYVAPPPGGSLIFDPVTGRWVPVAEQPPAFGDPTAAPPASNQHSDPLAWAPQWPDSPPGRPWSPAGDSAPGAPGSPQDSGLRSPHGPSPADLTEPIRPAYPGPADGPIQPGMTSPSADPQATTATGRVRPSRGLWTAAAVGGVLLIASVAAAAATLGPVQGVLIAAGASLAVGALLLLLGVVGLVSRRRQ